MNDRFRNNADSPMAPAARAFAVSPSDASDLPDATKAIYIGGAGDIALRPIGNTQDVVFVGLSAGTILDVRASAIRATGTTATNIVGLA